MTPEEALHKGGYCHAGHEYTPENTRVVRTRDGYVQRKCRMCEAKGSRRRYYATWEVAKKRGRW